MRTIPVTLFFLSIWMQFGGWLYLWTFSEFRYHPLQFYDGFGEEGLKLVLVVLLVVGFSFFKNLLCFKIVTRVAFVVVLWLAGILWCLVVRLESG